MVLLACYNKIVIFVSSLIVSMVFQGCMLRRVVIFQTRHVQTYLLFGYRLQMYSITKLVFFFVKGCQHYRISYYTFFFFFEKKYSLKKDIFYCPPFFGVMLTNWNLFAFDI